MGSHGRMNKACHAFMAFFSIHGVILYLCLGIHYQKGIRMIQCQRMKNACLARDIMDYPYTGTGRCNALLYKKRKREEHKRTYSIGTRFWDCCEGRGWGMRRLERFVWMCLYDGQMHPLKFSKSS